MRIVYVTPFLRVPPDFCIGLRNYHLLKHLAHAHSIHVITYGDDDVPETTRWLAERNITVSRLPYALPWAGQRSRGAAWRGLWRYPNDTFRRFAPVQLAGHLAEHLGGNPASDIVIFDTPLTGQALLYKQFATPAAIVVTDVYASLLRRKLCTLGLRPGLLVHLADYLKTTHYEDRVLRQCW